MFKTILMLIKRVVLSVLFIYTYNRLALPLDIVIPMNIITVLLVTLCGIPSILMLILYSIIFI